MADSTYHAGTISVAAGGLAVLGTLTAFLSQVKPGDMLFKGSDFSVIETVASNTGLSLATPWPGPDLANEANYRILRTSVGWHSAVEVNTRLTAIIAAIEAGLGFRPDATGSLADRALNNGAAKGFIFARTDVTPFEIYIKTGLAAGDWAGPTKMQGPPGPPGINGTPGVPGAKGDKGDTGATGLAGANGDKGDPGAKGDRGDKGDAGNDGAPGAVGLKGDKGDKGDQGDIGPKGDQGDSFKVDEAGPLAERALYDGEPAGFSFLDVEAGHLYIRQGAVGWSAPISFGKGETGDRGAKGDPGDVGPAGEKGARGDKGDPGNDGAPGVPGVKGDKGDKGDPGNPASNLVTSVAGRTGDVVVTKSDVGLGNVDNTSDANKPVSEAQGAAISARATAAQGAKADSALQPNIAGQSITGGASVSPKSLGIVNSGTVTPDPGDRPMQTYTNNGSHTLAPGAIDGMYLLDIVNGASAGAITVSGWTKVVGDAFNTTNGNKFRCHCSRNMNGSLLIVQAMQ